MKQTDLMPMIPEPFLGRQKFGFDDNWHVDHYGNKYATKVMKYKPCRIYNRAIDEHQGEWQLFTSKPKT
jgi:hypothetical protein